MLKGVVNQPKSSSTSLTEDRTIETSSAKTAESSLECEKKVQLAAATLAEEAKSDDATSIPDEESTELTTILEIELKTKEGVKRIEVKQGEDVHELACRIGQENELGKELEEAIEYKIKKALAAQQQNMFTY